MFHTSYTLTQKRARIKARLLACVELGLFGCLVDEELTGEVIEDHREGRTDDHDDRPSPEHFGMALVEHDVEVEPAEDVDAPSGPFKTRHITDELDERAKQKRHRGPECEDEKSFERFGLRFGIGRDVLETPNRGQGPAGGRGDDEANNRNREHGEEGADGPKARGAGRHHGGEPAFDGDVDQGAIDTDDDESEDFPK